MYPRDANSDVFPRDANLGVGGVFWGCFGGVLGGVPGVFWGCSGAVLVVSWGPNPQVSVPGEHIRVSVLGVHIWRAARWR